MMPDLKLNAYASLLMNNGIYARLYARYIDGVELPSTFDSLGTMQASGYFMDQQIDDHLTYDFHIGWSSFEDKVETTLSVINLTDEEPPLVPHELAYDANTHNPVGRIVKVGIDYRLQ
jgi:outer membrane receptor protein involved in Fe transport